VFFSSETDPVRYSGDDTNIGAIVGGAVGGGVGLVCLLLLLLALVVLVLARRRNGRRQMRKLTQPDYAELAYGDVDNVSLPKRKAEASPPLPRPLADVIADSPPLLVVRPITKQTAIRKAREAVAGRERPDRARHVRRHRLDGLGEGSPTRAVSA
jgi:hypothetical protein